MLSRRAFLETSLTGASLGGAFALRAARPNGLQIGVMDTVFRLAGKPESVALAKKLNLAGVQVTLGRSQDGKTLPLEDPSLQAAWKSASRENAIPLDSTYIDMLHSDCLKDNPKAPTWVRKGIEITKNLDAKILMMVFFGKCQVLQRNELDYAIGLFKELTPEAERAGVVLGFENTSSGEDNRYAVDKVNSKAFKMWYDVGNSTFNGYHVPSEIRMLGKDRICMFHFKDKGYLGEGQVRFPEILSAIGDIGFRGIANLETTTPSGDVEADTLRNIAYLRRLMEA
jgi:sugar phosphate isomerase/epimerase